MATTADGNKAIALGAIDAGIGYFSHYPGSPVNKVEPYLRQLEQECQTGIIFNDSLNEHVAVLAAAGASFSGVRSMVVMKHVGMNIAADPLNYLGYTGVQGAMVVVVGTDPGATCSTGEEDVHWYAPQINFPLLEPATVASVRECVVEAATLSERYRVPVLVFVPAALCYDSDQLPAAVPPSKQGASRPRFEKDHRLYTNVGDWAVHNHRQLLERIDRLGREYSRGKSWFNRDAAVGLVTRGATFGHTYEVVRELGLEQQVALLNAELTFPLDRQALTPFIAGKTDVFVIEDQDGFLEHQLKMHLFNELDCRVHGKDRFPAYGAISYEQVATVLAQHFGQEVPTAATAPGTIDVPVRMGTYCEGCPHRSSFYAIEQVMKEQQIVLGGDIGCSSLPPHKPDWLLCMNAGIGISQGMGQVLQDQKVVSTGGDGSFFHYGLISLLNAVVNRTGLLHVLFDNSSIAMTGHQQSPTGVGGRVDVRALLLAIGVDSVVEVNAFRPDAYADALREALAKDGVRVIWVRGECALQAGRQWRQRRARRDLQIHNDKCDGCDRCYSELQCPAINRNDEGFYVDLQRCMRCGVCLEICPNNAIEVIETDATV